MGLGLSLGLRLGGGGSGGSNPYMFFATRNSIMYGNLRVAPADTNYVASFLYFSCPEYETNDYRFHFSGFSVGNSAPTEDRLAGNDMIIDEVWFTNDAGSTWVQGQFAASNSYTVTSGSEGTWTDPVIFATATPVDGKIGCYLIYHTASGENQLSTYRVQNHNGERVWGANNLATLQTQRSSITDTSDSRIYIDYTGDFTQYGQSQATIYGPDFMVARGWDGRPVALVCADSIGESRQEYAVSADARGNLGYIRRWLDKTSTQGRIPNFIIGCPGVTSLRELQTASIKRWNVLDSVRDFNGGRDAWTVILNQHGNNDIGATFDINSNNYRSFVARLRSRYSGCKIVAMPHLVQTSSTDTWTSVGGQTTSGNNVAGGTRFQLRDAVEGRTSAYCDDCINNHVYEDPTDYTKWRTGLFDTTLASAVGTDGIATYSTIDITNTGAIQDDGLVVVSLNSNRTIRYVSGTALTLVQPSASVLPAGEVLKSRSSHDGLHPSPRMAIYMADNIAQTEKLRLASGAAPWFIEGKADDIDPTFWADFVNNRYAVNGVSRSYSDVFTHTRSTTGTYFDSAGVMRTAAINEPRFNYDPLTLTSLGLLVEAQRTNLVLNSATGSNQSITVAASVHTLSFYGTGTVTLSGVYAGSLNGVGAYPNRATLSFTPTAGTLDIVCTGTVELIQIEAGNFETSYIPTTSAAVTRAIDSVSNSSANVAGFSWYNQPACTLLGEYNINGNTGAGGYPQIFNMQGTPTTNFIAGIYAQALSGRPRGDIGLAGVSQMQSQIVTTQPVKTDLKMAVTATLNDGIMYYNGSAGSADTGITMPTLNKLNLPENMTHRGFRFYPIRVTNSELARIST